VTITWNDFVYFVLLTFFMFILFGMITGSTSRISVTLGIACFLSIVVLVLAKTLPGGPLGGQ